MNPAISALPSSGRRKPVRIFMVVDFPAPFGPRNPSTWPRDSSNDTPSTAVIEPKRLVRLEALIMALFRRGRLPYHTAGSRRRGVSGPIHKTPKDSAPSGENRLPEGGWQCVQADRNRGPNQVGASERGGGWIPPRFLWGGSARGAGPVDWDGLRVVRATKFVGSGPGQRTLPWPSSVAVAPVRVATVDVSFNPPLCAGKSVLLSPPLHAFGSTERMLTGRSEAW